MATPINRPMTEAEAKEAAEIERLRRTHALYDKYAQRWTLEVASYEGGKSFACRQNLVRHARENEADFNDRVNRLHYLNYIEPIIDFFTDFIYAETIQREGGKDQDFFNKFIKDVNLRGDDITAFMRELCEDTMIYGMVYTLVDAPVKPQTETVITVADEQELGLRPYWIKMSPLEILDWVRDEFGNFRYAKRKQFTNDVIDSEVFVLEKYTEWYLDRIVVTYVDITDAAQPSILKTVEIPNELGEIPLVLTMDKESKEDPGMGKSFLNDFADNAKEILNITSLIDEFLARQCFAILVKEAEPGIPTREQNQGEIGTANALEVPKDAKFPLYIAPPSDPAQFLRDERATIVAEMYRRASQELRGELANGEGASGFSQAQSFSKTIPRIANRADNLERTEMTLMRLTMKYMSKDWSGTVKYKDDYSITNFTDAVTQLMMLARDLQMPSELFIKTELKRLVHEYDGKLAPEDVVKIEKQIDSMDFEEWLNTQKEALVGKEKPPQGSSPAAQQKDKSSGTMTEASKEAKTNTPAKTNKVKD